MGKRAPVTKSAGKETLSNPKHELFCHLYAGYHNRELFGNGTRCYGHVYHRAELEKIRAKLDELRNKKPPGYTVQVDMYERREKSLYETAKTNAADLLTKANLAARIDFLLDQLISNDFMDRELAFTAGQRWDLNAKVAAIREFNRLKARASDKLEGEFNFRWVDETPTKKK